MRKPSKQEGHTPFSGQRANGMAQKCRVKCDRNNSCVLKACHYPRPNDVLTTCNRYSYSDTLNRFTSSKRCRNAYVAR